MIIRTRAELDAMREIGYICALTLKTMIDAVEPGISTKELDEIGAAVFRAHGAVSAPISCYNFPGENCISINDVVAHGIPGPYVIQAGDIVNIDVSAEKNGFFSDNAMTVAVPPVKETTKKLLDVCLRARSKGIYAARAGKRISDIGLAIEKEAHRHGMKTIKNLTGHGVGHTLHDDPSCVPNYFDRQERRILQPGLVLAIEPFVCVDDEYVTEFGNDGWTLKTMHQRQTAQFEHTVMVRENQPPLILTLLDGAEKDSGKRM